MDKKVALIVLDGFGISEKGFGNAIKHAKMPYFKSLIKNYSFTTLKTHGKYVGLNGNQFGNSEVGHLNLGAGRIVKQDSVRISDDINSGEFFKNPKLLSLFDKLKQTNGILHIFGLCSNGGVHSDIKQLLALLKFAKISGVKNAYVHFIGDGRDTKINEGINFYNEINAFMQKEHFGKIVSVIGRFYAMDREKNYDRTQKFYDILLNYKAENKFKDLTDAFKFYYKQKLSDEYLPATIIDGENFKVNKNDAIIAFNFRSDRMRQIFESLIKNSIKNLYSFIEYDKKFSDVNVIYEEVSSKNCLSEVLSNNNLTQLRISETTKYAHVTYFFNMLIEQPFKGENRIIIPSDVVDSFDKTPKMKAEEITNTIISETNKTKYDFILVNFPNCDMVGHTGNMKATIVAVEFLDKCLNKLCEDLKNKGYAILITADHGNADKMLNADGTICTTHSVRKAPLIIIDNKKYNLRKDGKLSNVSPTILDLFNIKSPKEFTEPSLIV